MEELEDALGAVQVTQGVFPKIAQVCSSGQRVAGKLLCGEGQQHLPAMGSSQQAREPVETSSETVTLARVGRCGMQRHPQAQRLRQTSPGLDGESTLYCKRRG